MHYIRNSGIVSGLVPGLDQQSEETVYSPPPSSTLQPLLTCRSLFFQLRRYSAQQPITFRCFNCLR